MPTLQDMQVLSAVIRAVTNAKTLRVLATYRDNRIEEMQILVRVMDLDFSAILPWNFFIMQ